MMHGKYSKDGFDAPSCAQQVTDSTLRATDIDVGLFLGGRAQSLPTWIREDDDLVSQIENSIAKAANGM